MMWKCTGYNGSSRSIFLCLEARCLDEKLDFGGSRMFGFYIRGKWVYFFFYRRATNTTHITVLLSAGAIATSFEVGRTPQFVEFRNFKVRTDFLPYSNIDGLQLVGRDHLACFISHHGPHHNNIPGLVFVSFFFAVRQSGLLMFLIPRVSVHETWIVCQFHDVGWLLKHSHKSGFKKSDLIINRIIRREDLTQRTSSFWNLCGLEIQQWLYRLDWSLLSSRH